MEQKKNQNHALLAPSAARIWLNCPASARAQASIKKYGDTPFYTKEGTIAHEIAAARLNQRIAAREKPQGIEVYYKQEIDAAEKAKSIGLDYDAIVRTLQIQYIDNIYRNFINIKSKDLNTHIFIETPVSCSGVAENCFGTLDAAIVNEKELHIYDLKYGLGTKVSALENPQLRLYAIGLIQKTMMKPETITLHVIQPRMDWHSSEVISLNHLYEWAKTQVGPSAKLANTQGAPYKFGSWCQFCKAAPLCPNLVEAAKAFKNDLDYHKEVDDGVLSQSTIGALLDILPAVKKWAADFEDYAKEKLLSGDKIEGYKVVPGRKVSYITSPESVKLYLKGLRKNLYLKPQELKPLGELKKNLSEKIFEEKVAPFIGTKNQKPIIVKADNPCEEILTNSNN